MAELMVAMRHARMASMPGQPVSCAPGVRAWFARYGLDLRTFLREGLPASVFEATGDAFALRAVAFARAEAEANRG